jgi:DNA-binding CsgD family transcriptional regulator
MVTAGMRRPSFQPAQTEESPQPEVEMDGPPPGSTEHKAIPITFAMQRTWPTGNGSSASHLNGYNCNTQRVPALRHRPRLSEREAQILDGLVKGYANKMIARSCDITEATVKVHMKSILRKIQVANRTQAAVWALEHGHSADETTKSTTASLRTIQAAKTRFKLLTASSTTQAELVSQIEICDVLLEEIRVISCGLANRMSSRGVIRRRSVVARRNPSSRYLAVPRGNPANCSKRKK